MTLTRLFQILPWALSAVLAVWTAALFAHYVPPFADLPQHAWTLAMLRHPGTYADAFEVTLRPWHTNSLWFVIDRFLAPFLSPEGSLALACTLAVAALPFALAAWAQALGRSGALALMLGWCVAWTRPLYWGFVNYTLSMPVAFAALALDEHLGREGPGRRSWRRIGLAALLVLLYLLHAQTWIFLLGGLALQRMVRGGGGLRGLGRRLGGLALLALPSVALFAPFAAADLVSPVPGEAPLATLLGGLRPVWPDVGVVLGFLLTNATATIKWSGLDDTLAKGVVIAIALGLGRALLVRSDSGRRGLLAAVGIALAGLAAYLFLPINVLGQFQISTRMAPWVLLALVPAASPVLRPWAHRAVLLVFAAGALLTQGLHTKTLQLYEGESAPAFEIIKRIPPGARVALWTEHRTSRAAYGAVYVHFLAWYAERKLGRDLFSFAEFRPNPVVYRDPIHYPRAVAGEETRPWCTVLLGDGEDIDYVVTRGDQDPKMGCGAVARYHDALQEMARVRDWALYKVTAPLTRQPLGDCPCGSRAPRKGPPRLPSVSAPP